jgi:hypothetical protein
MEITVKSSGKSYFEYSYLVDAHMVDRLIGRVLTLIETLGLRDAQEKAIKDLVKQEVWNNIHSPNLSPNAGGNGVDRDLVEVIYGMHEKLRDHWNTKVPTEGSPTGRPMELHYSLTVTDKE